MKEKLLIYFCGRKNEKKKLYSFFLNEIERIFFVVF